MYHAIVKRRMSEVFDSLNEGDWQAMVAQFLILLSIGLRASLRSQAQEAQRSLWQHGGSVSLFFFRTLSLSCIR